MVGCWDDPSDYGTVKRTALHAPLRAYIMRVVMASRHFSAPSFVSEVVQRRRPVDQATIPVAQIFNERLARRMFDGIATEQTKLRLRYRSPVPSQ